MPLLIGGLLAMAGGAVLAFAVIAAPWATAGVSLLAATAWALRRWVTVRSPSSARRPNR